MQLFITETPCGITTVLLSYIPVDGHTPQSEVQTAEVPEAAALMQVTGARVLMEDTRETQDERIVTVNRADGRCCKIALATAALAVGLGAPGTKGKQEPSEGRRQQVQVGFFVWTCMRLSLSTPS